MSSNREVVWLHFEENYKNFMVTRHVEKTIRHHANSRVELFSATSITSKLCDVSALQAIFRLHNFNKWKKKLIYISISYIDELSSCIRPCDSRYNDGDLSSTSTNITTEVLCHRVKCVLFIFRPIKYNYSPFRCGSFFINKKFNCSSAVS